jgi:hypothetical protein
MEWLWELLLGVLFGGALFSLLLVTTSGILVSLAITGVLLFAFGLLHYVTWGQGLSRRVDPEQQTALAGDPSPVTDEFTLTLSEQQRDALIGALEHSLAVTEPPQGPQKEMIRDLLDKLRGFGA